MRIGGSELCRSAAVAKPPMASRRPVARGDSLGGCALKQDREEFRRKPTLLSCSPRPPVIASVTHRHGRHSQRLARGVRVLSAANWVIRGPARFLQEAGGPGSQFLFSIPPGPVIATGANYPSAAPSAPLARRSRVLSGAHGGDSRPCELQQEGQEFRRNQVCFSVATPSARSLTASGCSQRQTGNSRAGALYRRAGGPETNFLFFIPRRPVIPRPARTARVPLQAPRSLAAPVVATTWVIRRAGELLQEGRRTGKLMVFPVLLSSCDREPGAPPRSPVPSAPAPLTEGRQSRLLKIVIVGPGRSTSAKPENGRKNASCWS